ncbi:hypothetical protein [Streptomyces hokutonensis]|uniref:hypothetical protein n=1 Tax=Streptomyces hokutonensis TaxID=1306990 RepID=UPI0036A72200
MSSSATIVIGCWQCGQFRVAVGFSGSRAGADCRVLARAPGVDEKLIRALEGRWKTCMNFFAGATRSSPPT